VWDFKLRDDVKFQDGNPLTAKDFVYTYERAVDPKTASPAAGAMLEPMKTIEAVDDYTLRITLKEPYYPILESLADPGYMMPLEQKNVEELGDKFGHSLISVGPYKLKEWVTGQRVTLEVNPDFKWAPDYAKNKGPYQIQTIEFPIIPEYATIVAGLQSGEINYYVGVEAKDVQTIKDTENFDILEGLQQGLRPYIVLNVAHKPFDDVRVRQAFNYAIDRKTMAKFVVQGFAVDQKGPLTPSQMGYSSEMDSLGYTFDLDKAKALLADAGYKPGADGIMAKDGVPLKFKMETLPIEAWTKAAEVAKDMYKALGVDMEIEQLDPGVLLPKDQKGDFDVSFMGMTYSNEDMMYMIFHSSQIGGMNFTQVKDENLDKLLDETRTETDPAKEQAAVNEAAKYITDNALVVFLYTPTNFAAISKSVQGYVFSTKTLGLYLEDASIK
jgi:peptide/nickel transport system substrate-binding protein